MSDHHASPLAASTALVIELAVAGLAGHVAQVLSLLPGWAGGILGGLVVHGLMRLVGPTLDVHAQRLKARVTGKHRTQPQAPADAVRVASPTTAADLTRAVDAPRSTTPDDATG